MTDQTNIVPFGKYKGQPIEVLAQDRPYLEWLAAQNWFRERYSGIYTLIVNNFNEVAETPDHNALQVLFLDDPFCERFVTCLIPQWRASRVKQLSDQISEARRRIIERRAGIERRLVERGADAESKAAERPAYMRTYDEQYIAEAEKDKRLLDEALSKFTNNIHWQISFGRTFEEKAIDVQLWGRVRTVEKLPHFDHYRQRFDDEDHYFSHQDRFNIEIKPEVGDDYPGVLRQMRANGSSVLFTQGYTGVGATQEQFVKTFAIPSFGRGVRESIEVVFRRDVDAVQLPAASSRKLVLLRSVDR